MGDSMSTLQVDTIQGKTTAGTVAMPAGMCVQTVDFSYGTEVLANTTSNTNTGIVVNITPKFASSKIYISAFIQCRIRGDHDHGVAFTLVRTGPSTVDVYAHIRQL